MRGVKKMTDKEKLKKQYNDIVEEQINNDIADDMFPIMRDVYHWGVRNIPQKELKKIIERNKK